MSVADTVHVLAVRIARATKISLHQFPPATLRPRAGPKKQSRWHGQWAEKPDPERASGLRPNLPGLCLESAPELPAVPPRFSLPPGLAAACTAQVSPAAVPGGGSGRAAPDPPRSTGPAPPAPPTPPAAPPPERESLRFLELPSKPPFLLIREAIGFLFK